MLDKRSAAKLDFAALLFLKNSLFNLLFESIPYQSEWPSHWKPISGDDVPEAIFSILSIHFLLELLDVLSGGRLK